jgi:hypothetical protein
VASAQRPKSATAPVASTQRAKSATTPQPSPSRGRLRQPPQPRGTPASPHPRRPVPASGSDILGTAVQAAAELAEIGVAAGKRALRNAVSKLAKP